MNSQANSVIDHLGGTSAVARLIKSPVSTVHSWRINGIPESRLDHLRLAANANGTPLPDDLDALPASAESDTSDHRTPSPDTAVSCSSCT